MATRVSSTRGAASSNFNSPRDIPAFQQLFGIRNGNAKETTQAFLAALAGILPAGNPTPAKAEAVKKVQVGKPLRAVWMDDLVALRGSVAHGHAPTALPSAWTAQEHLLLAAYVFPLLVKLRLSTKGKRPLTEGEEDDLAVFDLMLASANLFAAAMELPGIAASHQWNQVRLKGLGEARIRRAVAILGGTATG